MAEIRRYDEIMKQAIANMIANQDKITDFNEGSIVHTILDTVSRLMERAYVAIRQGYNDNLRLVPYSLFGFAAKEGNASGGTVMFGRDKPIAARTAILSGTRISGDGKFFITTSIGYIEENALFSNQIPIISDGKGTRYNVVPYAIDTIDSVLPQDVVTVGNTEATTGGTDRETEAETDERFKIFINGLSGTNTYAIMSAALTLNMVRSVSVKTHKPPLRDIYNLSVYVDDGSGSATEQTISAVKLAIEGDGTEANQGHLCPGINIRVLPPTAVPIYFSVVAEVYRADLQAADSEIRRVLAEYVNGLTIGKSVIISEAISRLMNLSYIRDIKIPQENVELQSEQIARYADAQIEIREINNV